MDEDGNRTLASQLHAVANNIWHVSFAGGNIAVHNRHHQHQSDTGYLLEGTNAEQAFLSAVFNQKVWPNTLEWCTLPLYAILLIIGLIGNSLVIYVVLRNESMRTVTNIFLTNLACSDLMVLLFCLPPTVLWDITDTWFFGQTICRSLFFVQNLSVTVSILTLVSISVERWYAICNPLRFKSTMARTVRIVLAVWFIGAFSALPESITLRLEPFNFTKETNGTVTLSHQSVYFTKCTDSWGEEYQLVYQLTQTVALFVVPLTIIAVMYFKVAYVLWVKSLPPTEDGTEGTTVVSAAAAEAAAAAAAVSRNSSTSGHQKRWSTGGDTTTISTSSVGGRGLLQQNPTSSMGIYKNTRSQSVLQARDREVLTRRKAAKMLIAVVILFTICYFPVHLLNILKAFKLIPDLTTYALTLTSFACRFLTYFSSSINPILYNFMSEKFRKEFRNVGFCCVPAAVNGVPDGGGPPHQQLLLQQAAKNMKQKQQLESSLKAETESRSRMTAENNVNNVNHVHDHLAAPPSSVSITSAENTGAESKIQEQQGNVDDTSPMVLQQSGDHHEFPIKNAHSYHHHRLHNGYNDSSTLDEPHRSIVALKISKVSEKNFYDLPENTEEAMEAKAGANRKRIGSSSEQERRAALPPHNPSFIPCHSTVAAGGPSRSVPTSQLLLTAEEPGSKNANCSLPQTAGKLFNQEPPATHPERPPRCHKKCPSRSPPPSPAAPADHQQQLSQSSEAGPCAADYCMSSNQHPYLNRLVNLDISFVDVDENDSEDDTAAVVGRHVPKDGIHPPHNTIILHGAVGARNQLRASVGSRRTAAPNSSAVETKM